MPGEDDFRKAERDLCFLLHLDSRELKPDLYDLVLFLFEKEVWRILTHPVTWRAVEALAVELIQRKRMTGAQTQQLGEKAKILGEIYRKSGDLLSTGKCL